VSRNAGLDESELQTALHRIAGAWRVPAPEDLQRMAAVATRQPSQSKVVASRSFRQPLHSRGRMVAAAVIALLLIGAGGATAYVALNYAPSPDEQRILQNKPNLETLAVKRQVHIDGTTWTVVGYESSAGTCLQAYGAVDGHDDWQGKVGGCGKPDTPLVWGAGGLRLGARMFTVTWGQVPSSAKVVEVTLTDGSTIRDRGPLEGVWIAVLRGDPRGGGLDFSAMRALDAEGHVVARAALPQIGAYRDLASKPQAAEAARSNR
jgi:hypothetical protein